MGLGSIQRSAVPIAGRQARQVDAKDLLGMARLLFEDVFEILKKDPDGKRFDRVSRFHAQSDTYQMELKLDVNVDIYPLEVRCHSALRLEPGS